ncbi:MAG TPA: glycosyltransferase family 1 protein [Hyphomicrobiaceae bacterium]|nr:glycosyltransferase family 1 protein [Hyphomicrobiaceae bacterium]
MRAWTINGDFTLNAADGVKRYATEVTRALDSLVGEGHPLARGLDLSLIVPAPIEDPDLHNIPVRVVPEFRRPRLPQVWCQLQLPRHVSGGLLSFCNLAPVAIKKQIVCIHDMQTRLQPESYGAGFRLAHRVVLPLLGRRCFAITTVSDQSAADLVRFGIAGTDKIAVTWNGADHARAWRPEKARVRFLRPYVFGYVRPQAHKNAELFWKIASGLDAMGLDIVLSGSIGHDDLARFGQVPGNVRLVGRLNDDEVAAALKGAVAFLLPSRAEGFGLPVVEAMIWGCPVVASDIPALRSVGGEAALYADPEVPQAWTTAVGKLAARDEIFVLKRSLGRVRAQAFSWRRIAERYLELMARADGAAPT